MKLFIDSANIEEIQHIAELGVCDGVTTNPTLVAKSGRDFKSVLREIVEIMPGPVSAEVVATDGKGMVKEGEELVRIAGNVVVKLPMTQEGLKACRTLTSRGIKTNVTLCFSVVQALLAAKVGATYVSPFVGRLDDVGEDGIGLIRNIRTLYATHKVETKILAASVRNTQHVTDVAILGADAATIPYKVFSQLYQHELTTKGLALFQSDWIKSGQKPIV